LEGDNKQIEKDNSSIYGLIPKKGKHPSSKLDPSLNQLDGQILFPEKLEKKPIKCFKKKIGSPEINF